MGIQNNLKICDSSCIFQLCIVPLKIFMARKYGMRFLGVLFEALEIFLGFDFSPHSIIFVT